MEKVFKQFSVESKAVDAAGGIYAAMISTEQTDRQGDIVRAAGARVDNYLKNPVVLWAHDYNELPVAKALNLEILPGQGIRATFQFPELGTSEKADAVRRLWAAGFLGATSIGFSPIKASPIETGWDFAEWEMLEFSIVPVPANANALRLAMKALDGVFTLPDGGEPQAEATSEDVDANAIASMHDETETDALIAEALKTFFVNITEVLK